MYHGAGNNFPGIASQFAIMHFYMTAIQDIFCGAVFLHRSVPNLVWNICLLTEFANQIWCGKLFPVVSCNELCFYLKNSHYGLWMSDTTFKGGNKSSPSMLPFKPCRSNCPEKICHICQMNGEKMKLIDVFSAAGIKQNSNWTLIDGRQEFIGTRHYYAWL